MSTIVNRRFGLIQATALNMNNMIGIGPFMVWSELGAAMPASGGSFGYLREAYGRQFILSGPLEIASGYIGFANYLGYIWPGLTPRGLLAVCAAVGVVNVLLLYRRIKQS